MNALIARVLRWRVGACEVVEGSCDGGGVNFIQLVFRRNAAAIETPQDAYVGAADRKPFQRLLPRGTEHYHRQSGSATDMHGARIERDKNVAEAEYSCELRDRRAACERQSLHSGGVANSINGCSIGCGAEEDGVKASGFNVADDSREAVVMPAGALAATALYDESGARRERGFEELVCVLEFPLCEPNLRLAAFGRGGQQRDKAQIVFDETQRVVVFEIRVVKRWRIGETSGGSKAKQSAEKSEARGAIVCVLQDERRLQVQGAELVAYVLGGLQQGGEGCHWVGAGGQQVIDVRIMFESLQAEPARCHDEGEAGESFFERGVQRSAVNAAA